MAKPVEVLLTSDGSGQFWNVSVWNYETGAQLRTYKGAISNPRTLSLINHDFLLSGQPDKPLLNLWRLANTEQVQTKLICPGRPSSVAVSPDGTLCVVGIAEKIHFWQLCTGNLLAVVTKHYLPVTCLKFTDDGGHVVSGGEDTVVNVWPVRNILDKSHDESLVLDPYRTWSHHSLPVTDIHVGRGGICCRVFTVSADHTCKIYDLVSGLLLLNLVLDVALSAVVADPAETRLFAGAIDGRIFQINLFDPPRSLECHVKNDDELGKVVLNGHSKKISDLRVSSDGRHLASGCYDHKANVWHVESGHCLTTLAHKGPVTNVLFVRNFDGFFAAPSSSELAPAVPPLKRTLTSCSDDHAVLPLKIPLDLEVGNCVHEEAAMECGVDDDVGWKDAFFLLQRTNEQLYESILRVRFNC